MEQYSPGSLDQLKALQGVINMRKEAASRRMSMENRKVLHQKDNDFFINYYVLHSVICF